jgi:hypothetical protein
MSDNASSSSSSSSSEIVLAVDPRYKFGKIYKIFCDIEGEDDIYVGSTVRELEVRLDHHFIRARINTSTLHKFYSHMKRLGLEHFHIMMVEEYPCENDFVLRKREQYWMDELKPSLNTKRAFSSLDDLKASKRNCDKIYRNKNNVAIKAQKKIYRTENKEAINAKGKIYYADNKVALNAKGKIYKAENALALKAQSKVYYQSRKDEIKVKTDAQNKIDLESGATYCSTCDLTFTSKSNLRGHKKSSRHKAKELANLLASEPASSTTV